MSRFGAGERKSLIPAKFVLYGLLTVGFGFFHRTPRVFPAPPSGEHHVLWVRTAVGWRHQPLQHPDQTGQALQVVEAAWLTEGGPLELRITRETRPADQPAGVPVVSWSRPAEPSSPLP